MDTNGSGSLSCVEFQSGVCGVLQYCRANDAKRLFYGVLDKESQAGVAGTITSHQGSGKKDAGRGLITWREFGITAQEWLHHCHEKREAAARRDRKWHEVSRNDKAIERHVGSIRDPKARTDLAFSMPLPKGWGLPGTPEFKCFSAR